jgi:hypothetical protein
LHPLTQWIDMKPPKPHRCRDIVLALPFAVALLSLSSPAFAQQAGAFAGGEKAYPFTDLPGVKSQEDKAAAAAANEVVCTRSYDDTDVRRWGEFKHPVYTCTQNGRSFSSRNPPPSRERELRGFNW